MSVPKKHPFKIGDVVICKKDLDNGIEVGERITITSVDTTRNWSDTKWCHWVGFICNVYGDEEISSGVSANWNAREFELLNRTDFISKNPKNLPQGVKNV